MVLAEWRSGILGDARVGGEGAVGRVSLAVEVGELVDAVGGFGRGQVTRVVARGGVVQALHAAPGTVLVRTSPQIAMLIAREIAGGGAGVVGLMPRGAKHTLRYLHHAGIRLVLRKFG